MKNLEIKKTNQTPEIHLNAETGILSFSGRSLPEDSAQFYKVVFDWLNQYIENLHQTTDVIFEMDYFNTASAKAIFSIIIKLDELYKTDYPVTIRWMHDDDDDDMKELGEEYQDLFKIPIKIIAQKNE